MKLADAWRRLFRSMSEPPEKQEEIIPDFVAHLYPNGEYLIVFEQPQTQRTYEVVRRCFERVTERCGAHFTIIGGINPRFFEVRDSKGIPLPQLANLIAQEAPLLANLIRQDADRAQNSRMENPG